MNKLILTGNLTADPVQRDVKDTKVTEFRIAVNRRKNGPNGEKVTDFFRVTQWGARGDASFQYLAKGRKVLVIGELQARTYEDGDGKTRMSLDVAADEVEFLTPKSEVQETVQKPKKDEVSFEDIQSDDIPF